MINDFMNHIKHFNWHGIKHLTKSAWLKLLNHWRQRELHLNKKYRTPVKNNGEFIVTFWFLSMISWFIKCHLLFIVEVIITDDDEWMVKKSENSVSQKCWLFTQSKKWSKTELPKNEMINCLISLNEAINQ